MSLDYNNQLVQYGFQNKKLPVTIKARQLTNYPLILASLLQKRYPRKTELNSPLTKKFSTQKFKRSLSIKRIQTPKKRNQILEESLIISLKPLSNLNEYRPQTTQHFRTDSFKDSSKLWSSQSKRAQHYFRSRNKSAHSTQHQFTITRNGRVEFL